jgi:sugar/nucleoside kinase (ribokinase family)
MIQSARLLTLDLYGGEERILAASMAREAGLPVVVGDVRTADHPVLPHTTVAIASAAEIATTAETFSQKALAMGAQQVIVTDGPRQAKAFDAEGQLRTVSPPSVPVIDTTGAGDAFRAGIVYGTLTKKPLQEILALGVASGSLNVGTSGAATHPPKLDEVLELATTLMEQET